MQPLLCLVLALVVCEALASSSTCPYTECSCTPDATPPRIYVDCRNKNLHDFPTLHSVDPLLTWSIDISNNSISEIHSRHIPANTEVFRTDGNPLTYISDNAFQGSLTTLKEVTISNSQLTFLPHVIEDIKSLETLYVESNTHLHNFNTTKLPHSLKIFYCRHNAIDRFIKTDVFAETSLEELHLENNRIRYFNRVKLPSTLKKFHMFNNALHTLTPLVFSNNTSNLEELFLWNNPLERITSGALDQVPNLKSLALNETSLKRLPLAVTHLHSLVDLELGKASHQSLVCTCEEGAMAPWYHQTRKATGLSIHGNCGQVSITTFLDDLYNFCPKPNCPYASCSCKTDYLPPRVYVACQSKHMNDFPTLDVVNASLTWSIDVSDNSIATINSKQIPANTEVFRTDGNPLTHIADDTFEGSESTLTYVVISHSQLTSLPRALENVTNLETMYVESNPQLLSFNITKFPKTFRLLYLRWNAVDKFVDTDMFAETSLGELHLEFNKISHFDNVTLPSTLKKLHMFNNQLHTLTPLIFYNNTSNLEELFLWNNPLTTIASNAFDHTPKLRSLVLAETSFLRLPLAVTHLHSLINLELGKARHQVLVCTCAQAALAPWYHQTRNATGLSIHGNCGHVTITKFLDDLAPSCPPPSDG